MSTLLKEWQKKKEDLKKAREWNDLPSGPKYENASFTISIVHCSSPTLVRAGQQNCGGQNYWNTPDAMNKAILAYLVANWERVWPEVEKILEVEERAALIACQSHVDEMQNAINAARDEQ